MKRLQVKQNGLWAYVFCYKGETGKIITLPDHHRNRALPAIDLAFFQNKYASREFRVY